MWNLNLNLPLQQGRLAVIVDLRTVTLMPLGECAMYWCGVRLLYTLAVYHINQACH